MTRKIILAVGAFCLLGWSPPAGAFDVIQITDNGTSDDQPAISGSNVAWRGCDGSGEWYCTTEDHEWSEIHLWDGVTANQITNDTVWDCPPAISGSNVVWADSPFWRGIRPEAR